MVTAGAVTFVCASTVWYLVSITQARNLAQEQAHLAQQEAEAARRSERERAATVDLFCNVRR